MSTVALQNEYLRLVVDPENGAGTLAFSALINGQWLALMPDTQSSDGDLACANFLMVPYSNRIENGRFEFAGQTSKAPTGCAAPSRPPNIQRSTGPGPLPPKRSLPSKTAACTCTWH
jgi:hypothetical protein